MKREQGGVGTHFKKRVRQSSHAVNTILACNRSFFRSKQSDPERDGQEDRVPKAGLNRRRRSCEGPELAKLANTLLERVALQGRRAE